ncbi:MAG: hypothetical protein H7A46_26085 [Verrucomicrobiales bacterium]|nr:hypothetical protein [Verrucomicrobiales bacterium]
MKRNTLIPSLIATAIVALSIGCASMSTEQKEDSAASPPTWPPTPAPPSTSRTTSRMRRISRGRCRPGQARRGWHLHPGRTAAALEDLPVTTLQDEGKASIVIMGTVLLDEVGRRFLDPMTPEAVQKVACGIRDGIQTALARFDAEQARKAGN